MLPECPVPFQGRFGNNDAVLVSVAISVLNYPFTKKSKTSSDFLRHLYKAYYTRTHYIRSEYTTLRLIIYIKKKMCIHFFAEHAGKQSQRITEVSQQMTEHSVAQLEMNTAMCTVTKTK